jgi:hypothetical protein
MEFVSNLCIFVSSLCGSGFVVVLKVDKYFVEMCCLLPKLRSNLFNKAAIFYTHSEKKLI